MTYSLADSVRFAAKLKTEAGKPLRIADFQKWLLTPHFTGTRETVAILPTGNGKTTLLASLGLYHMLRVPNAQVLIVASAEEQAATLFKQMRTLAAESAYADLLDVKGGQYRIYHKGDGPNRRPPGEIRVIASEVKRQEGAIPTLVLVDELHAHKNLQMYEMLRDKLWKRGAETGCGRMIAISTAGFTFDSPLFRLKRSVEQMPTYRREGYCYRGSGPGFEWFEYALAPDEDRDDLDLVAKINPARWVTKRALAERKASPTMSPGEWARSACNVWTAGEDPAILPEDWDRLRVDIGQIEDGEQVILVPSVGHVGAVAIAAIRPDDRVAVAAEIVGEQENIVYVPIERKIRELCNRYNVEGIYHPLGGFQRSAELLESEGYRMIEQPQSPVGLSAASGTFNRLLRAGLIMHDGDPVLRDHVLMATTKVTETGERYEISDRSRALIAVVMAVHAITAVRKKPTIHIWRGASNA